MAAPRPTPISRYFFESQSLSTKKEKCTPGDRCPPRPPVKSVRSLFRAKVPYYKATTVSFKDENTNLSKRYDESSAETYFKQCFDIEKRIGAGSFGAVYQVRSKENGRRYAIKRSLEKFRGASDRRRKFDEVKKHEILPKHPNCIQFIKAWEERDFLYIQTELCEMSLSHYSDANHDIPETIVWRYFIDLLLAVKHLHDHNLIHLDIKPANIFISTSGICKLGDFGLVLDLRDKSEAQDGDSQYLAKEIMDGKFTKAADIFSLGITILELACDLDLPHGGPIWHQLREDKIPFNNLKSITPELQEIICMMMTPDYTRRPNIDEILRIPSVANAWKQRRRQLWIKLQMEKLCNILFPITFYLLVIWKATVVYPLTLFIYLFGGKPAVKASTPDKGQSPERMNLSFSDDDSISDHTSWDAFTSYHDSDEDEDNSIRSDLRIPDMQRSSTPDHNRLRGESTRCSMRRPMPPELCFDMFASMNLSPVKGSASVNNIVPHNSKRTEEMLNSSLGPKNLMESFISATNDAE